MDVFVMNVVDWGVKCLMATSFSVIDVLPNDLPIFQFEDFFSKDIIGLEESIEDEPVNLLASETRRSRVLWESRTYVSFPRDLCRSKS
jgi:hypothetical protein